jgi:Transposase
VRDDGIATTVMLGLSGFRVLAMSEHDSEFEQAVRTTAEEGWCLWFTDIADREIADLLRLARTLDAWREELLAYFDTGGVSNGPTEAINELIKKIKRVGHGYRNFANYRLPAPPAAAQRHHLAHSSCHPDQRAITTLNCVEPLIRASR